MEGHLDARVPSGRAPAAAAADFLLAVRRICGADVCGRAARILPAARFARRCRWARNDARGTTVVLDIGRPKSRNGFRSRAAPEYDAKPAVGDRRAAASPGLQAKDPPDIIVIRDG